MFVAGDVLNVEWDSRPIRVLMGDEFEVFYDVFWPSLNRWGLQRARTANYYRVRTNFLFETATKLRSEPLSQHEVARHRPDLPLRLTGPSNADWTESWESSSPIADVRIDAPQLALIPFGPKGGMLAAKKLDGGNGLCFSGAELFAAAKSIQNTNCNEVSGIGIYRSGISGGIPSYYLWGATDRAGSLTP